MKRETSSIPPNSLTLPVAKRDHIERPIGAPKESPGFALNRFTMGDKLSIGLCDETVLEP